MTDHYILIRFENLDRRIAELTQRVYHLEQGAAATEPAAEMQPERTVDSPAVVVEERPEPPAATETQPAVSSVLPTAYDRMAPGSPAAPATPAAPAEPRADWEATLGGNWLNKIGAFVLVVGIALLLGYSFRHMGPLGRDAVGLAGGLAMLGAGMFYESRPRYQVFARGLIGGGWAALYFTVYAMQALDAAKVIESPVVGAVLLVAVAAGMIIHALRYRSEAVAGVAYFSAFVALAITQVTALSIVALIPLAASLLYIARRFRWSKLALFGLVATYAVCASRGDTGAPLWTAQAIFTIYWLLFEGFEILVPGTWLMPWNALGFLSLSLLKWNAADPAHVWAFLAASGAAYAAGGVVRARLNPEAGRFAGGWHGPATATAALLAAAIIRRLDYEWLLAGLLAEGELFYLCGLRFRARYLRLLAIPLFAIEVLDLSVLASSGRPVSSWMPVAAFTAAVFYANRAMRAADILYGYAAAAVAALIAGYEAPARECGRAWFLLAAGPFLVGWWRRLADFRYQGYLLACLGVVGSLLTMPHPPLSTATGATLAYGLAVFALWSAADRFVGREQSMLFDAASTGGAAALAILLRAVLPHAWVGPAWAAEALLLALAALRVGRAALRWQGAVAAAAAFAGCWYVNFSSGETTLAAVAAIVCLYAAQLAIPREDDLRLHHSLLATVLTTGLLYFEVSGSVLTVAWGVQGLALLASGFPLRDRALRLSGLALLLFCILKLFIYDLSYLDTLPRIFSFIVLGLILVGVSWIYTRFRERIQRYL